MAQPAPQSVGPRDADLSGTTVGRFAVRARLGKGGMGEVYRAYDTALKRPVALKRITPRLQSDENYRRRFLHEAQCASGLTDQHIAGLYDVLEANNEIFLVMEYVEGVTLRQQLQRPISIEKLLGIAVQCAAALVAAHERGIVHRDLKPENIMLTPTSQVKILDFGVAKQLPPAEVTATTETVNGGSGLAAGTPAYMAPEALLEKDTDPRADIFSLGVILYEAVSGRHPFLAGSFMATSDRTLHEVPPPLARLNPKVPAELGRIVAKMLAKDPDERYATAADLLVDLRVVQRAVAHPAALPARDDSTSGARGWITRNKGKIFVAALGLLLVISIGLLSQVQRFHWFDKAIAGPKNVAVLPFQAIGGAPEDQAFSDGITEALTVKLTQLTATHQLQVAPGREVRARRISGPEEARKELGASLILEGTVYRSGNTVRVNYALVDT
ncbi:MAG TPA: serine/threonine-protein kinase, partial [Terriglobales bacterium]|nr:serine/threonine-protein kinase [Terriglobales bacterium]